MSTYSLQARWVLPIDHPPIAGGVVTVSDGLIVEVGRRPVVGSPLHDLGDVVLMPGLVNAHTHLEFSLLDTPLGRPDMSLPEWIQLVISSRQRSQRDPSAAVLAGMRESLRCGVTTLADIATCSTVVDRDSIAPNLVCFQEAIGFSSARVDSVLEDVRCRLDNVAGHLAVGLSPHAPYSVHPRLLKRLVALATQQQLPVAMHLAESPEEGLLLSDGEGPFRELLEARSMWDADAIPPGSQTLDYLKILAPAPRTLVVHGNYLSSAEIGLVAEHRQRMYVVYCPRTHAYFGHPAYPLDELRAAGASVALGTDSRASNPDLNLLAEMRFVAKHHRNLSPTQIVRMGTLGGAEALGLDGVTGAITPGRRADLTAVPCPGKVEDPAAAVLADEGLPRQTWVGGQPADAAVKDPHTS